MDGGDRVSNVALWPDRGRRGSVTAGNQFFGLQRRDPVPEGGILSRSEIRNP